MNEGQGQENFHESQRPSEAVLVLSVRPDMKKELPLPRQAAGLSEST